MDIVAAYQLVGTYQGAAEICGTTHKTVKRVIERTNRHRPSGRGASPEQLRGRPDAGRGRGQGRPGRASAKRLLPQAPARPATPVRTAASGGWSRRKAAVPPRARPWPTAGGVVPGRAPRDRLGRDRRGARLLRRARLVEGPVRAVRRGGEAGHDAGRARGVLQGPRRGTEGGARGPDELPQGRWGVVAQPRRAQPGVRPVRHALPVPGGLLRGTRPAVQRSGGEPRRARQGRPDAAAAARARPAGRRRDRRILCGVKGLADLPAANARAAAGCAEVNANVHSPRDPRRDHIAGLDAALTHELLRPPKRLESLAT